MTTKDVQHIADPRTNIRIQLPAGFGIQYATSKIWFGGSADRRFFLQIEREDRRQSAMPTIYADGDLDLYIVSTGQLQRIHARTVGYAVTGDYQGMPVKGFWAKMTVNDHFSYLTLLISHSENDIEKFQNLAMAIMDGIAEDPMTILSQMNLHALILQTKR